MMRWSFVMMAVLALPLAANAEGLFKHKGCESGDCGGSGHGHGWGHGDGHGGHAPLPNTGRGFGFFQPPFQAAPWYLYWPYDQHFQMPAPINAPYYAPQALGNPAGNPYFSPAR
jgi:hypothetical protein